MEVVDLLPVDLVVNCGISSRASGPPIEALAPVSRQFLEVIKGTPRAKSVRASGAGSGQRVSSSLRWRSCSSESVIVMVNGWRGALAACSLR